MRSALVPILLADPMPWAFKAPYAWDFLRDRARFAGGYKGALSNTPNWTFTRASTGYAQTSGGVLQSFASGELRRTDKGVLIEGAGTNLCLQSQTFDNASWSKVSASVTANAVAAPDGTTTADLLIAAAASSQHRLDQTTTIAAAAHTFSVFLKAGGYSFATLRVGTSGVVINLTDGTTNVPTAGWSVAVTTLANGWYRVALSGTASLNDTVRINVDNTESGASTFTGDGTSGIYLWGAQLEAAAFASSYIPTTTASATRSADVLTVPVSGIDYPISLFAETDLVSLAGGSVSQSYFEIDDSSNDNRALLYGTNGGSQASRMYCATANVQQALPTVGALAAGARKTAGRCSLNSFQVAGNGTLATEDTSGTVPATPNRLVFGKENGTGTELFGYLRRAAIWTRALSDAELQALTAA